MSRPGPLMLLVLDSMFQEEQVRDRLRRAREEVLLEGAEVIVGGRETLEAHMGHILTLKADLPPMDWATMPVEVEAPDVPHPCPKHLLRRSVRKARW